MQLLGPLHLFRLRTGNFNIALACARRCSEISATLQETATVSLARASSGTSLHLGGILDEAYRALEAALRSTNPGPQTTTSYLVLEGRSLAGAILARNLWLQGHTAHAAARARPC